MILLLILHKYINLKYIYDHWYYITRDGRKAQTHWVWPDPTGILPNGSYSNWTRPYWVGFGSHLLNAHWISGLLGSKIIYGIFSSFTPPSHHQPLEPQPTATAVILFFSWSRDPLFLSHYGNLVANLLLGFTLLWLPLTLATQVLFYRYVFKFFFWVVTFAGFEKSGGCYLEIGLLLPGFPLFRFSCWKPRTGPALLFARDKHREGRGYNSYTMIARVML